MPLPARILLLAVCGVAGYFATARRTPPPPAPAPITAAKPAPRAEDSLIVEWRQFRARHGDDAAAMGQLYAEVKDIADVFRRGAFRSVLIAEWAARDPVAALVFLQEKDAANAAQLVREWLRLDPQAAIGALLAGGEKYRGALREALGEIARVAPERLAEICATLPKLADRPDYSAEKAFAIFAEKNPDAARAAAESVNGPLRAQALADVAGAWAERDGAAALAWAQSMPAGEARDAAMKALLVGWAKSDPLAALDHLDLAPGSEENARPGSDIGSLVLGEAAKRDWDATIRWLVEHPGKLGASSMYGMKDAVTHRLNVDPAGTLDTLAQHDLPDMLSPLSNSLLNEGYAQRDAVWRWLDRQPASDFTKYVRGSLLSFIAWKEPDTAMALMDALPDTPANNENIGMASRSLLNNGAWMHRFDDLYARASPKVRPYLLATGFGMGGESIKTDPAPWLARVNEFPPAHRGDAIKGVAYGMALNDPQAAIEWALTLADPVQRDAAFNTASRTWVQSDTSEAAGWINSLPAGANRDVAAENLADALSSNEPESAWSWALSIQTPAKKIAALQRAYASLQKKDPAMAQRILQSAGLAPDDAAAVRKNPKP